MAQQSDLSKLMSQIISASQTLVESERISLFSLSPNSSEIVCQVSSDASLLGQRFPLTPSSVGHAFALRKLAPVVVNDAAGDVRLGVQANCPPGADQDARSVIAVPIPNRAGAMVACLHAVNRVGTAGSRFSAEDAALLESLANAAGIIMHNSRLFHDALLADRKSRALLKLVRAANTDGPYTTVAANIVEVAYSALSADRVTIYWLDEMKGSLRCMACQDLGTGATLELKLGQGLAGWVAQAGVARNVSDAYTDEQVAVRVSVCLPVLCMGLVSEEFSHSGGGGYIPIYMSAF